MYSTARPPESKNTGLPTLAPKGPGDISQHIDVPEVLVSPNRIGGEW